MNKDKIINISLIDVLRLIKADKRKMLIYMGVAGIIGLIFAFTTPKTYKATVILAPEESGTGFSGSLSSLASMVGMDINIGKTGDAIYPEIYPELVSSNEFIVGLFPITVTKSKTGEKYTYQEYLQKHQKIALSDYPKTLIIDLIKKLKKSDKTDKGHVTDPFYLTKEEYDIVKNIAGKISCSVDKKTSVITITVEDQDPLIAATVADSVQLHLQQAITDYRTKKARFDLDYMNNLYEEVKQQYKDARLAYAACADSYQNVSLQSYKQKVDDLENEMNLKYTIYQQVSEHLHLAKAKVQERTPAFTNIQKASVPVKHSSRPKIITLAIWLFLGFSLRFCMLIWKNRQLYLNI